MLQVPLSPEVPARAFRMVCDSMLQGLARRLRCLGADVLVLGASGDHRQVAEVSGGGPPRCLPGPTFWLRDSAGSRAGWLGVLWGSGHSMAPDLRAEGTAPGAPDTAGACQLEPTWLL